MTPDPIRWENFTPDGQPRPVPVARKPRRWASLGYRLLWEWSENATYVSTPVPLGIDDWGDPMVRCKGEQDRYERLNVKRHPFHLYAYLHGRVTRRVAFLEGEA